MVEREGNHDFAGETAVVTGASRGLGKAIAYRLSDCGANVVLASRDEEALEAVAADIETETLVVPTDVQEYGAVESLAEQATEFGDGTVEILVANAGANFHVPVAEMSPNAFATIVDINLGGTYNCCHAFADALFASGNGRVVTMSSVAGRDGYKNSAHYAAAKAGIEAFTRTVAMEWATKDVRVNCVRPGLVATPGVAENRGIDPESVDRSRVDRTVGRSDEVADLVAFLVAPETSYVTGETYTIEGPPSGDL